MREKYMKNIGINEIHGATTKLVLYSQ